MTLRSSCRHGRWPLPFNLLAPRCQLSQDKSQARIFWQSPGVRPSAGVRASSRPPPDTAPYLAPPVGFIPFSGVGSTVELEDTGGTPGGFSLPSRGPRGDVFDSIGYSLNSIGTDREGDGRRWAVDPPAADPRGPAVPGGENAETLQFSPSPSVPAGAPVGSELIDRLHWRTEGPSLRLQRRPRFAYRGWKIPLSTPPPPEIHT